MERWDIFRKRFKARRNEKGLSLRNVAKELNIAPSSISRFENGEIAKISADRLDTLCDLLDCDSAYLWGYIDTPHTEIGSPESDGIDEARLVKKYRKLTEPQKATVHQVMDTFIEGNSK